MKRYMLVKADERFLTAICGSEDGVNDELRTMFASFVCSIYRHPGITKNIPTEIFDISLTPYLLFRKLAAEGEKLPTKMYKP